MQAAREETEKDIIRQDSQMEKSGKRLILMGIINMSLLVENRRTTPLPVAASRPHYGSV